MWPINIQHYSTSDLPSQFVFSQQSSHESRSPSRSNVASKRCSVISLFSAGHTRPSMHFSGGTVTSSSFDTPHLSMCHEVSLTRHFLELTDWNNNDVIWQRRQSEPGGSTLRYASITLLSSARCVVLCRLVSKGSILPDDLSRFWIIQFSVATMIQCRQRGWHVLLKAFGNYIREIQKHQLL